MDQLFPIRPKYGICLRRSILFFDRFWESDIDIRPPSKHTSVSSIDRWRLFHQKKRLDFEDADRGTLSLFTWKRSSCRGQLNRREEMSLFHPLQKQEINLFFFISLNARYLKVKDVIEAMKSFFAFASGKLLREVNSTIILLVPKMPNPTVMGDFRPISCCNTIYKCITKWIANT